MDFCGRGHLHAQHLSPQFPSLSRNLVPWSGHHDNCGFVPRHCSFQSWPGALSLSQSIVFFAGVDNQFTPYKGSEMCRSTVHASFLSKGLLPRYLHCGSTTDNPFLCTYVSAWYRNPHWPQGKSAIFHRHDKLHLYLGWPWYHHVSNS